MGNVWGTHPLNRLLLSEFGLFALTDAVAYSGLRVASSLVGVRLIMLY